MKLFKETTIKSLVLALIFFSAIACVKAPVEQKSPVILGDPTVSTDYTDPSIYSASNCYIIKPLEQTAEYLIPVEERIKDFWTNYANSPVDISNGNWDLEVLWYDCDQNPITTGMPDSKSISVSKLTSGKLQQAMKIVITSDFTNWGNILVAVKQDGKVLWSWHLWLTDYNPYVRDFVVEGGAAAYEVSGGNVHRYNGKLWEEGGVYANKVIMDRNIGARNPDYSENYGAGSLYYQFGRKDPIPGTARTYLNGNGFESLRNQKPTFAEAVQNPTIFYANGTYANWVSESEVDAHRLSVMWNDKNSTEQNMKKSIFDPSPLGWMLPLNGVWDDFSNANFSWDDTMPGRTYTPVGALYPTTGFLYTASGEFYNGDVIGYSWSINPYNNNNAYHLHNQKVKAITSFVDCRAYGFPARAIQE